jgi:hypothetical protein
MSAYDLRVGYDSIASILLGSISTLLVVTTNPRKAIRS